MSYQRESGCVVREGERSKWKVSPGNEERGPWRKLGSSGHGGKRRVPSLTLYSTTCDIYYHSLLFGGYLGISFP